ncbi:hypothetical protein YC2023_110165 [Brassica napus]
MKRKGLKTLTLLTVDRSIETGDSEHIFEKSVMEHRRWQVQVRRIGRGGRVSKPDERFRGDSLILTREKTRLAKIEDIPSH